MVGGVIVAPNGGVATVQLATSKRFRLAASRSGRVTARERANRELVHESFEPLENLVASRRAVTVPNLVFKDCSQELQLLPNAMHRDHLDFPAEPGHPKKVYVSSADPQNDLSLSRRFSWSQSRLFFGASNRQATHRRGLDFLTIRKR